MKKKVWFVAIWMFAIGFITEILQIANININSLVTAIIIAVFFFPLELLLYHISKNSPNKTNRVLSIIAFLFIIMCYLGGLISTIMLFVGMI